MWLGSIPKGVEDFCKKFHAKSLVFYPSKKKQGHKDPGSNICHFHVQKKKTSMFGLGVNQKSNYKAFENFKTFLKPILYFHYFRLVCIKITNP